MKQSERSQRRGLKLGLIGVGSRWEKAFLPALNRLRQRTQILAVYNPAANRATQIASSCQAKAVFGIRSLLSEQGIEAVLLLEGHWQSGFVLEQLCQLNIPAVISLCALANLQNLKDYHDTAMSLGLTLMPEFNLRHMPCTIRLQELLATRLGALKEIEIEAPYDCNTLLAVLDWCHYITGQKANRIHTQATEHTPGQEAHGAFAVRHIQLAFPSKSNPAQNTIVNIKLVAPPQAPIEQECIGILTTKFQCRAICTTGEATLTGPTHFAWCVNGTSYEECLDAERSDVEVILDHFCRRVVGGLIPVPDLADFLYCQSLLKSVQQSQLDGRPVIPE